MKNISVFPVMPSSSVATLSDGSRAPGYGLTPEPLMLIRRTCLPAQLCYVTSQGLSSVLCSAQALCRAHFSQGMPFRRQKPYGVLLFFSRILAWFSSSSGARPAPGIFFSLILHSPLLPLGLRFDKRQAPPLASARLRAITVFPVGLVRCPANGADALPFAPLRIAQGIYCILMFGVIGHSLCAIDSFYCIRGTRRAVPLVWPGDSVWRSTDGTAIRAAKLSHIPRPFAGFVRCRLCFPPLQAALGAIPCAWAAQE